MKIKIMSAAVLAVMMLGGCGDTSKVDKIIADSRAAEDVELNAADKAVADQAEREAMNYLLSSESAFVADSPEGPEISQEDLKNGDIDIDLVGVNSNITYAQVFAMVNSPEEYVGKTVRVEGTFAHTVDGGKDYYAVFIADAAACCQQGMEFVRAGEYAFPQDYPAVDTDIQVTGTFATYDENGYTYCTLENAVMTDSVKSEN
ncbi:MAG: hypothetical protein IJ806_03745 [Ruminococcus sp.]|nr:hypothetical protein [Ruminococcus sp.]